MDIDLPNDAAAAAAGNNDAAKTTAIAGLTAAAAGVLLQMLFTCSLLYDTETETNKIEQIMSGLADLGVTQNHFS